MIEQLFQQHCNLIDSYLKQDKSLSSHHKALLITLLENKINETNYYYNINSWNYRNNYRYDPYSRETLKFALLTEFLIDNFNCNIFHDLGSGLGTKLKIVNDLYPHIICTGFEINEYMLKLSKRLLSNNYNCAVINSDLRNAKFSADLIYLFNPIDQTRELIDIIYSQFTKYQILISNNIYSFNHFDDKECTKIYPFYIYSKNENIHKTLEIFNLGDKM